MLPMRPVSTQQPRSILFWSGHGWLEVNIKQGCLSGIRYRAVPDSLKITVLTMNSHQFPRPSNLQRAV